MSPTKGAIDFLLRGVLPGDGEGLGDGELLARYVERHDEAALAALVRRHGPMVWGVCSRALRDHHDAEDAFQATFLVLVRKAVSVVPREMVGNWLYGVARQATLQARRGIARRQAREVQVTDMPDTPATQPDLSSDLQAALDEELVRLPAIYRAVVVLCDLEGRTRKEVARQLGVPEGTVAGRLSRARAILARRLARRGVSVSSGALATVLARNMASAGVPNAVLSSTVRVATLAATGRTAAPGAASVKVTALTNGVLKTMLISKLKSAGAVVLVLAALTAGATFHLRAQVGRAGEALKPHQDPASERRADARESTRRFTVSRHTDAGGEQKQPAEPAWKKEFREVYGLKDGELVKRIAPPYPKCRADYLADRFRMAPGIKWYDDYFTILRWKGDWAPPELARHTWPVRPADGITVVQLLDRAADIPVNRIVGSDLLEGSTATGDFVIRDGADPEKVVEELQTILQKECGLRASFEFKDGEQDVFVLTGKYTPKPVEGRGKDQIEVYAKHLVERPHSGVRDSFDHFLLRLEQHIGHRVVAENVEGLPKTVFSRFHVRSPAMKNPAQGIDTLAEDTAPHVVMANVADQTGLEVKFEKRKVRVLVVSPEKPKE